MSGRICFSKIFSFCLRLSGAGKYLFSFLCDIIRQDYEPLLLKRYVWLNTHINLLAAKGTFMAFTQQSCWLCRMSKVHGNITIMRGNDNVKRRRQRDNFGRKVATSIKCIIGILKTDVNSWCRVISLLVL